MIIWHVQPMPPKLAKCRLATGEKCCPYCDSIFNVRGYGRHEQACHSHREREEQLIPTADTEGNMDPELGEGGMSCLHLSCRWHVFIPQSQMIRSRLLKIWTQKLRNMGDLLGQVVAVSTNWKMQQMDSLTSGLTGLSAQTLNASDIVIEYHPHSERDTRILSPEEFKASLSDDSEPTKPPDDEPWWPFHSREDFEFVELVCDAALNWTQIDRLIKLVQHYQDTLGSFMFHGYNNLKTSLENASKLLTLVTAFVACAGFTSAYPVFSFSVMI